MGVKAFLDGNAQVTKDDGTPNASGTLEFYEPGTSTPKAVYSDSALGTSLGATVTLNSAGRYTASSIWMNGNYKVIVKDSSGNTIRTEDEINPENEIENTSTDLANPSFEEGLTASWKIYQSDGSTDAVEGADDDYIVKTASGDVNHGTQALELRDGAIAVSKWTGGGNLIPHSPDEDLVLEFSLLCGGAGHLARVTIVQYSASGTDLAADVNIFNSSSGNPTAGFELKTGRVAAASLNASMRYYSVKLKGGNSTDEWARFDGIRIGPPASILGNVAVSGTLAVTGVATFTAKSVEKAGVQIGDNDNLNKTVDFKVTGPNTVGFRCVGMARGTTSTAGASGTAESAAGIITSQANYNPGSAGRAQLFLARALSGESYSIQVTCNGAAGAPAFGWWEISGGDLYIYTQDGNGTFVASTFSVIIFEHDI
jgi:hypothetical protein